ncbi:MAG: hypothetical protein JSV43_04215 [Methanobacteriota archaeon]|nr:MAG: hypothetical protein JSV43_04215 [Euryarchaeota archaeon]
MQDLEQAVERMKPGMIIIAGAVILVVGASIGATAFLVVIKDPSVEAVEKVEFVPPDYMDPVILNSGMYDIWYESGVIGGGDPGDIIIRDVDQNLIYRTPSSPGSEKITVNNKEYIRDGTFNVDSSGTFSVTVEYSGSVLYFTRPIDVAGGFAICSGGIGLSVVGGLFIVGGIIILTLPKKKPPTTDVQQEVPPQQ